MSLAQQDATTVPPGPHYFTPCHVTGSTGFVVGSLLLFCEERGRLPNCSRLFVRPAQNIRPNRLRLGRSWLTPAVNTINTVNAVNAANHSPEFVLSLAHIRLDSSTRSFCIPPLLIFNRTYSTMTRPSAPARPAPLSPVELLPTEVIILIYDNIRTRDQAETHSIRHQHTLAAGFGPTCRAFRQAQLLGPVRGRRASWGLLRSGRRRLSSRLRGG